MDNNKCQCCRLCLEFLNFDIGTIRKSILCLFFREQYSEWIIHLKYCQWRELEFLSLKALACSSFQQREDRSLSLCSIIVSMSLEELYTPRGHYLCARHCTGTMAIMKQQIMRSSGHQHLQSHFYIIWFTPPPALTTINRLRPLSSLAQSDKICKYCKQSAVGQLIVSPPSHIAWIKYFLTHLNFFCFSSVGDSSHVMNKYQLSYTLRRYLKYFIYKIISIITINTWKGLA